jgi:hypothetical protein
VDVNLVDGTTYRAIFYTSTPFEGKKFQIVLKNAKKVVANQEGGSTPTAVVDSTGTTMVLPFQQIKLMTASKSKFPSTSQGFSPFFSSFLTHSLFLQQKNSKLMRC